MLIVVVWFVCVYVVHINRTKLKFAFFAIGAQAKIRYFGSLSVAPSPLRCIFLFLIMSRHPINNADLCSSVWL
jgi:hypothetical protein